MDVTNIVWNWVHGTIPNDGFMVKRSGSVGNLDSTLDEGSSKQLGTSSNDHGYGLSVDSSDNIYLTGETQGKIDENPHFGQEDIFLSKFDIAIIVFDVENHVEFDV